MTTVNGTLIRSLRSSKPLDDEDVGRPEHKPALIVDRDGVLNSTDGFVNSPRDLDEQLFPEALDALARLQKETGMPIVVVTNQGGLDAGKMTPAVNMEIQQLLAQRAAEHGAKIDAIYFSPNNGSYRIPEGSTDARKPGPGMFFRAQRDFDQEIDLADSYMVGDMSTDLAAAQSADSRIKRVVVDTGFGGKDGKVPFTADYRAKDLSAAVDWILAAEKSGSSLSSQEIAAKAEAFILAHAGDDVFHEVDGGNCGLSAYQLSPAQQEALVVVGKAIHPGDADLQAFDFNPSKTEIVSVVTSDDEPHMVLIAVDRGSGETQLVADLNTVDMAGVSAELAKKYFPQMDPAALDGWEMLTELTRDSTPLELGAGSKPFYWT